MKRRALLLTCAILCLLAACGGRAGRERERFLDVRMALLEQDCHKLRASVRADYGERIYSYVLSYEGNAQAGTLTVEEPELIAGVSVLLEKDRVRLQSQELLLETGEIIGELNPLQAFPLLLRAWCEAGVTDCWRENRDGVPCLVVELDLRSAEGEEPLLCRTWFHTDTGKPLFAELGGGDRVALSCIFLYEAAVPD